MKKYFVTAIAAALFMFLANPVLADQNDFVLDEETREEIKGVFDELGILFNVQSELFEKIEKGELLDANNPEMQDKGVIVERDYITENGEVIKENITVFPDGSRSLTRIEPDSNDELLIQPFASVPGGATSCGPGYCNYANSRVTHLSGFVSASYRMNYTIAYGGMDYISRVYEWQISGAGSVSNITLTRERPNETSANPAYAFLRFTGTIGGNYTTTFYLRAYVGGDRAWATANW